MSDENIVEEKRMLYSKRTIIREIIRETVVEVMEIPGNKPIVNTITFEPLSYERLGVTSSESLESLSIDDLECRKEIAKLLDIQDLPTRSPNAYSKLDGLFDDIVQPGEEIDVTKWVKSMRKRK